MTNTKKALEHYKAMLKVMEECQSSNEITTFTREAVKALEKQMAKEPETSACCEKTVYICKCGKRFKTVWNDPAQVGVLQIGFTQGDSPDYCPECGQRLKWED